jgi:hypothetical protein
LNIGARLIECDTCPVLLRQTTWRGSLQSILRQAINDPDNRNID